MQTNHPVFEIVTTTAGAISIRNKVVNEIMHNPVGPWAEANALYIDQSGLRNRLAQDAGQDSGKEFVIFDVGLGAAANALAALACIYSLGDASRPVRLVSFERDLELLRFALDHSSHFDHFAGYEKVLEQILEKGFWSDGKVTWELRHGNFLDFIDQEPHRPHLIFYDPYSPKMNQEMWTTECFTKLRAKCRDPEAGGTSLYTYSRATRIRASLIVAGFYVAHGMATGLKDETTQASTDLRRLSMPLAHAWFERWRKSHLRHPFDCQPGQEAAIDQIVDEYMQRVLALL